ncbi:MAG: hypothetical protein WD399_00355 [Thermoleophilaceae bacterium]
MEPFGIVVIATALVGALIAILSFLGTGGIYRSLGRTGLSLDEPELRASPARGTDAWEAEAAAELRQLVEAKSDRREARGEEPLDVEAELARLGRRRAAADPSLRAEVRELVVAANERRARRGLTPLEVEPEVERRLGELRA